MLRLATLAFGLVTLTGLPTQACTPDPGQCCQDIQCDGNGWANLEIKAAIGGATVHVTTPYTDQDVVLDYAKRLGLPTDAAANSPEHLVYFDNRNRVHGGGGAPFSGTTAYGPISGKVGGFKWYAVSALKDPTTCPPDNAVATHEFGCYALTNAGATRIGVNWTDQFGNQSGSFSTKPATVCFPANGKPGKPFVCWGDSDQVGPGPGSVCIDTPYSAPGFIQTDRYDEICAEVN